MEKGNGFMSKKSPSTVELMAVKNESKSCKLQHSYQQYLHRINLPDMY